MANLCRRGHLKRSSKHAWCQRCMEIDRQKFDEIERLDRRRREAARLAAGSPKLVEASHPDCNYTGWMGCLCTKCGNIHNSPPTYRLPEAP